jgi:hypothetical protein
MEKRQKLLIVLFTIIAIVTLSGFLKSYLFFFPNFGKFRYLIHLHFAAFTCWLLLIVIQPILIRQKKIKTSPHFGKVLLFFGPAIGNYYHVFSTPKSTPGNIGFTKRGDN